MVRPCSFVVENGPNNAKREFTKGTKRTREVTDKDYVDVLQYKREILGICRTSFSLLLVVRGRTRPGSMERLE